jgi:cytochrome P450
VSTASSPGPALEADFERDFFRDESFVPDPYPFFDHLRDECPVLREPHHGVYMVTGYEEAVAVYHDTEKFSSCNSVTGPFPGFPVPIEGRDDVDELIAEHRDSLPFSDQITTMDPPKHTDHRALLLRLITPKRLKENEDFMWRLADRQLDEILQRDHCEFIREFASPFAMLVVADLLGVPEADHDTFRRRLGGGNLGSHDSDLEQNPLQFLYDRFSEYVEDRRTSPRDDVLTGLASATFPDGSLPEVIDVVRIAANLFAAGQETTVRLLAASLQIMGERPELQAHLRADRSLLPNFVEEMLRLESPVKGDFRLSRCPVNVGGVDLPAGATLMVLNGAANHDPRRFASPREFQLDRENARQHLSFGFGAHTCPGAPLARSEARISLERILDRMADIRISEAEHGPPGARRYEYAPTYILRGLVRLHLEYTPIT